MEYSQKQVLESFVRVNTFVAEHPATGPLKYGGSDTALVEVVRRIQDHAGVQVSAPALSRGQKRRLDRLTVRLRNHYMRPLVTTAREQVDPETDARLPDAFRMPAGSLGPTRMLQMSDAMLQEAAPFEAALVTAGLPADFFEKFRELVAELRAIPGVRSTLIGSRVGARQALEAELRRGRLAVSRLDAVVRATWDGNEEVLAKWRVAKRVQKKPGGTATPEQLAA